MEFQEEHPSGVGPMGLKDVCLDLVTKKHGEKVIEVIGLRLQKDGVLQIFGTKNVIRKFARGNPRRWTCRSPGMPTEANYEEVPAKSHDSKNFRG